MARETTAVAAGPAPVKFGTFGGVFTPNLLTILGVIMFLRAGWVVGNAGLQQALLMLAIANGITLLTSLSLSAISTNIQVKGGGAYFLISRSLGLEVGGAIGVPLYFAQSISVAFYILGFAESLTFFFPNAPIQSISIVTLAGLFLVGWLGADLAIKTQYIIMAALGLSLLSFFLGYVPAPDWGGRLSPQYEPGHDFWTVFAIYFPAVTGIMSGVSMSGDLKNPSRSIPRGTLWAVGVSFVIYATQMYWLSVNASREQLLSNNLVMKQIAVVPALIFAGLWAATLSSALASLVAAPRTLQALGRDRVVPRILGRGHGPQSEPRIALVLTLGITVGCLLLGDLNLIAPVITMFFLITYGMTNLAAGLERWVNNPSYRPTFHVHWLPSILGAIGCGFVMFLLSPLALVLASGFILGLYLLLKRLRYQTAWGDMRSGFWFALTRMSLLKLDASRQHARNWRPVILALVGSPKARLPMLRFANWLESGRGLLFLAHIVSGDWRRLVEQQPALQRTMQEFILENRLSAVAKTVITDDFARGVTTLLQVAGVGQLQPNTVLIGYSEDAVKQQAFQEAVQRILELRRNLLVYVEAEFPEIMLQPRIDVWWRARQNGSLMLTLAHLLQRNARWRDHTIRVLRIIDEPGAIERTRAGLTEMLSAYRIKLEVEVIASRGEAFAAIAEHSARSSVCFVGLSRQALDLPQNPLGYYDQLAQQLRGTVFITKSWHEMQA